MNTTRKNTFRYGLLGAIAIAVTLAVGCKGDPASPIPVPDNPPAVSFNVLSSFPAASGTDTIYRIRVSWTAPVDPFGAPEYYIHTMTATETITDGETGPLPTNKQTPFLVDTVAIKVGLVNQTVTLTSNVWSFRRGLKSSTPAVGTLVIRRGDRAPLPPGDVTIDTLVIG